MRTNPGGQLSPEDVVGRDRLIQNLWRILDRQSLVLTAERRMGKTSIIKKMEAEAPDDRLVVFRDLEGLRTPLEFVDAVFQDVEKYLSRKDRTAAKTRQLLTHLSDAEFQGLRLPKVAAPHWKSVLVKTIEDLIEHQNDILIFFWDEVPLMLANIKQDESKAAAMEILDVLRSLRQTHPSLRMVFTGSIGLHHVITHLKQVGYANAPTNDMYIQDVAPLSIQDAKSLALGLLQGEAIQVDDSDGLAASIAVAVDCIPFYIHHVVDELRTWDRAVNSDAVEEIVQANLTNPMNRWAMEHYWTRIDGYYQDLDRQFALGLLDILAIAEQPLSFREIFDRLKTQISTEDRDKPLHILMLLQRDHYVIQQSDGAYRFSFPLIQRYWQLNRGL